MRERVRARLYSRDRGATLNTNMEEDQPSHLPAARPRPGRARAIVRAAATVALGSILLAGSACGSREEGYAQAERLLQQGALDRAEYLLRGEKSGPAEALRQRIAQARQARALVDEQIAGVMSDATLEVEAKRAALNALNAQNADPQSRASVQRAIAQLADQAMASAASSGSSLGGGSSAGAPTAPTDAANTLQQALDADDFERALELLAASAATVAEPAPTGATDADAGARDRQRLQADLEARLALRQELLAKLGADARPNPADVADLPSEFLSARKLRDIPWSRLQLSDFQTAASKVALTRKGQIGLLYERMRISWGDALQESLRDLNGAVEKGWIPAADAHWHLARLREEAIPPAGYRFENGQWVDDHAGAQAPPLTRRQLRARLLIAGPAERDRALLSLRLTGDMDFLRKAVLARWERDLSEVRSSRTLPQLAKLAEDRRALDDARAAALAAISDTKIYFYPFDPPDRTHSKAQYLQAQKKIDTLLDKVRRAWSSARRVKLPEPFRTACEDLAWVHDRNAEYFIEAPLDVPSYVLAIDPTIEELDLHAFAWTRQEMIGHRRDADQVERSAARLKSWKHEQPAQVPDAHEMELVQLVNDYRRMMGRSALAFNAKLHVAASVHADNIARTGVLSHLQDVPAQRSPTERMASAGYDQGAAENLAGNLYEPREVLAFWLRSSQQHRTLLEPVYTEVGAARTGLYWVMDFGKDPGVWEALAK